MTYLANKVSNLYQQAIARVIFPLHESFKGHETMAVHQSLEESQWLSPGQMEELQIEKLRRFLVKIGSTVPYYEMLFTGLKFRPQDVKAVSDLQCLPLLDKPTIRSFSESLRARHSRNLKRFNTGGSSGEPLIFYLGNERVSHDVAAKRRATRWWGVDIGDREIVVWGSPIELDSQGRLRQLRDKLLRTELLSAFEMSNQNLHNFARRIQRRKPRMLFGYPSSLALIAHYVEKNGNTLNNLGIEVVFVTSECLYDYQREVIERVFGCPVANGYGGRDAGFIAHQCPSGAMHITSEDIVVEIVDEAGMVLPEETTGEIVVTHLYTSEFPFVRYRTGDIGSISSKVCACGRGLPILAQLEGRTTDFITAADGTVLHGLALIYVLRDLPEVEAFKVIQESIAAITVQLVTATEDKARLERLITDQFRRRLGDLLAVNYEYLARIPRERSGKFRYVVSKLEH